MKCFAVRWEDVDKKEKLGEDQVFVFLGEEACQTVYVRSLEEKEGASFLSDILLRPDFRWKEWAEQKGQERKSAFRRGNNQAR